MTFNLNSLSFYTGLLFTILFDVAVMETSTIVNLDCIFDVWATDQSNSRMFIIRSRYLERLNFIISITMIIIPLYF